MEENIRMKKFVLFTLALFLFSAVSFGQDIPAAKAAQVKKQRNLKIMSAEDVKSAAFQATTAQAVELKTKLETYRNMARPDSANLPGYIMIADEPRLFDNSKQAMFVVTRDTAQNTYLLLEMYYSDGSSTTVGSYFFPDGVSSGVGFPLMNGELSYFAPQGPFKLRMYVADFKGITYVDANSTTYGYEDSFAPKMLSPKTTNVGNFVKFTIDGKFMPNVGVRIYLNWFEAEVKSLTISSSTVSFIVDPNETWIPNGKFRIVMCQQNTCDSYVGRR